MSVYWIQFSNSISKPDKRFIWVLLSVGAIVLKWLLPLTICVGQGPTRRQNHTAI